MVKLVLISFGSICLGLATLLVAPPVLAQAAFSLPADGDRGADAYSPIRFAISIDNPQPLAQFHDDEFTGGILKDLGDAMAARLHRRAVYSVVPRKRLDSELADGRVDGVCYDRPEWQDIPLNWTQPVIANEILLVAGADVPKPQKLDDVAGQTIGLVLGYKYPELEALNQNYRREDAPSMTANIKKLIAGRMKYAIIDKISLDYLKKSNPVIAKFSTLTIARINAACGFSMASKVPFSEIDQTTQILIKEGIVARILDNYR